MKTLFLVALLGASALSTAAAAQDAPPPGPPPPGAMRPMGPMGPGGMGMGMRAMLPQPDANGEITKQAVLADVDKRFAEMDTNHDGKISPDERRAAMAAMRERMGGRRGGPEGGPGRPEGAQGGPEGARGGPDANAPDETLADARERALRRFDRLDTNHDGKLDSAELAAMRDRMMAMRGRLGGGNPPPPPPPADAPPPPGGN